MATTEMAVRGVRESRWLEAIGRTWQAWRDAGIERRLVPAEARFFDAYSRGGTHERKDLVIDLDFTARPRVRAILRRALLGRPLNRAELEAEYAAWEGAPDLVRFRANADHLARCLRAA